MEQSPEWILGSYDLLQWDPVKQTLILTEAFQSLLNLLAEIKTIDSSEYHDLNGLNQILQRPQGEGGLLRRPGSERWHIVDLPAWVEQREKILRLLAQLGFIRENTLSRPLQVDHCMIFAATAQRMTSRIRQTVELMQAGNLRAEHIFLLGSKRPLIQEERDFISSKIKTLSNDEQRKHWGTIFSNLEDQVESNALLFLWETLAPIDIQRQYEGNVINIQSTRIGASYYDKEGHRPTTAVTADDWLCYYKEGCAQSIFALAEQPYGRLCDQLRVQILNHAKRAALPLGEEEREQLTFYFAHPTPHSDTLIGVYLDEIARNIYRISETLRYLEQDSTG